MFIKFASVCALALLVAADTESDFTAISAADVPQSVTSVLASVTYSCLSNIPKVQFTIRPSTDNNIAVKTNPANLFTLSDRSGVLEFSWNKSVAESAAAGGVIIDMPTDKLTSVTAGGTYPVQVLDGFTKVTSLRAKGGAILKAHMQSLTTDLKLVETTGNAEIVLETNVAVETAVADGDSKLGVKVDTTSVASVEANGNSVIGVVGNAKNVMLADFAEVGIKGKMTGTGTTKGNSKLDITTITGSIIATGVSKVATLKVAGTDGCNNVAVTFPALCGETGAPKISVKFIENPLTATGGASQCTSTWNSDRTTTFTETIDDNSARSIGAASLHFAWPSIMLALTA